MRMLGWTQQRQGKRGGSASMVLEKARGDICWKGDKMSTQGDIH